MALDRDILVIFHANCADGFCSAWAAKRHFGDRADYLPANHGEPPPDVANKTIYLLDFSYKQDAIRRLVAFNDKVVVIDHHVTAQAELTDPTLAEKCGDKLSVTFDMGKSGGRLAWEYFHHNKPVPWLVDYTEDRDLWLWKLPKSREISAAIASHPHDFDLWDRWAGFTGHLERLAHEMVTGGDYATDFFAGMVKEGAAILRYQQQQVDSQVKNAREIELDGHKILAVNATHLISEIAGELAKERPFAACWFVRGDGKKVWSLRSREGGVDVSEIARRHGGGGHRQAAGYEEG